LRESARETHLALVVWDNAHSAHTHRGLEKQWDGEDEEGAEEENATLGFPEKLGGRANFWSTQETLALIFHRRGRWKSFCCARQNQLCQFSGEEMSALI